MPFVKNRDELVRGSPARELVLDAFEHALQAVEPQPLVRQALQYREGAVWVGRKRFSCNRVFAIGMGKASGAMAEALEKIVPVESGVVVVPEGTSRQYETKRIRLVEGSHPLPTEKSEAAALELLELAPRVREGDLVLCLVSGGGSSLVELPQDRLTLSDLRACSDQLMKAGADIVQLNEVRKCLSRTKGGQLGAQFSKALLVNLVLSDVVGSPLREIASGPTVSNTLDYPKAAKIVKERLDPAAADRVWKHLNSFTQAIPISSASVSFVLADNDSAIRAAASFLRSKGLKPRVFRNFRGEAWELGGQLSRKLNRGVSFVAGGETTVTVRGTGVGGRNQELALGALLQLKKGVLLSAGTDGIDGTSSAAGAIIDASTAEAAARLRLDAASSLSENDSNAFFRKTKDAVRTGYTGTNVNDVVIGFA